MPFDKQSAVAAGKIGGRNRWRDKDPATLRNKQLKVSLTQKEYDDIVDKAAAAEMTKADLVVSAVKSYRPKKKR